MRLRHIAFAVAAWLAAAVALPALAAPPIVIAGGIQPNTTPTLSGIDLTTGTTGATRVWSVGSGFFNFGSKFQFNASAAEIWIQSNTADYAFGSAGDLFLFRDGANILAQRNGTTGQTSRLFNSFTDALNKEWLDSAWAANLLVVQTNAIGTGTVRSLEIGTNGTAYLGFRVNGALKWKVDGSTFAFLANTDNTIDIGATGANRPRDLNLGRNALIAGSFGAGQASLTGLAGEHYFVPRTTTALSAGACVVCISANALSGATTTYAIAGTQGTGSTPFWWITADGSGLKLKPPAVSGLPTCSSANDGMRSNVTDATATTFASAVTGGGANHVPVYCDGSGTPTWKIGRADLNPSSLNDNMAADLGWSKSA